MSAHRSRWLALSVGPALGLPLGLMLLTGCGSEKARAPETPAGASAPEATEAQEPDAFGPLEEERSAGAGDDLDQLLAMEADLGRYEAQLWRAGVPVRAYAQRPETETLGRTGEAAAEDEAKPNKDASERDRAATAPPPSPAPKASSKRGGGGASTGKASKAKNKKAERPYAGDAARDAKLGAAADAEASAPAERCETVCEVAAAICDIETRLCEMADRHPDDPRYQNACERASDDCKVATDACQQCSAE